MAHYAGSIAAMEGLLRDASRTVHARAYADARVGVLHTYCPGTYGYQAALPHTYTRARTLTQKHRHRNGGRFSVARNMYNAEPDA